MKIAKNVLGTSGKGSTNSKSSLENEQNVYHVFFFFVILYNVIISHLKPLPFFLKIYFTPHFITTFY